MNIAVNRLEDLQPIGLTAEADTLSINFANAMNLYVGQSVFISRNIETEEFKTFLTLKEKWKEETLFVSSGSEIISNSAYQEIISLGKVAIPWIIRELKKTNDHWFYALEKITGVNPIGKENIGLVEKMKEDWILWAKKNEF